MELGTHLREDVGRRDRAGRGVAHGGLPAAIPALMKVKSVGASQKTQVLRRTQESAPFISFFSLGVGEIKKRGELRITPPGASPPPEGTRLGTRLEKKKKDPPRPLRAGGESKRTRARSVGHIRMKDSC